MTAEQFADALKGLHSLEVMRLDRLEHLRPPRSIVLVGGACAGKSTLARAAAAAQPEECVIAARVSTRPQRLGDSAEGLTNIDWDHFRQRVRNNEFQLSWERPLADGSCIGYGCLPTARGRMPILMAGHGLYTNPDSVRPVDALDRALVVGVNAPLNVRRARFESRSPDVVERDPRRAELLLMHDGLKMRENVDLVVHNFGAQEMSAPHEFVVAIKTLATC